MDADPGQRLSCEAALALVIKLGLPDLCFLEEAFFGMCWQATQAANEG